MVGTQNFGFDGRWGTVGLGTVIERQLRTTADGLRAAAVLGDRRTDVREVSVGNTPGEVIYRENKLRLIRYESLTDTQCEVPILVVYALINRPFILDLQENRSVVRRLLEAGHDVYLVDWGEPTTLDASLSLYDYVERYLSNCVDEVRRRAGRDSINLLGYCMGGTMSATFAALHPERVNALGLLATGLCFDGTGGVLERWSDRSHFDPRGLADAFGTIPREFLAAGFASMDPVENYAGKYVRFLDNVENEDFVENFARMERWLTDGVDVAGEAYAEFVEKLYQENRLCENDLTIDGRRVDVSSLNVPILQIVGQFDALVPNEASLPFNDVVASDDVTTIRFPTGHVGLSVSTSTHRAVWPEVAEWYLEHSGLRSYADAIAEGVEEALGVDVETDVTEGDVAQVEIGVADERGEIARELVDRDPVRIASFFERTLNVDVDFEIEDDAIVVEVRPGGQNGAVTRTRITRVGESIPEEIQESIQHRDFAAHVDLQSIAGIGPTYAGRLRDAGVQSIDALARSSPDFVAEATNANRKQAREWIRDAGRRTTSERGNASERDSPQSS